MNYQALKNSSGEITGIYIPIEDWEILKTKIDDFENGEYEEPTKEQLLEELKQAFEEIRQIEKGELKTRPLKEFLNEFQS
jgi:hypothetical protein